MMKHIRFALLLSFLVSGCGQPGPLYLPTSKPPVYVEPDSVPEAKDPEQKPKVPQPDIKQPATNQ